MLLCLTCVVYWRPAVRGRCCARAWWQALAPTACTTIEEVGSTGVGALTLGFLALAVSTVVMVAKAASADAERRKYYFCNTFICGVATFSYFAMLSGQGWTAIAGCRQFFYARYVDWMITTALLILDLGLVAGQDFVTIAAVIGADRKLPCPRCRRPAAILMIFSICWGPVAPGTCSSCAVLSTAAEMCV